MKYRLSPAVLLLLVLSLYMFGACDSDPETVKPKEVKVDTLTTTQLDSIEEAAAIARHDTFPRVEYKHYKLQTYSERLALRGERDTRKKKWKSLKAIITLNRQELRYIRKGEDYVVPDSISSDMRLYSIFPYYYWGARNVPKIIMVSNAYQCYGCYEKGVLVRFAATNTGKERTQTYPGRYAFEWKEREHLSSLDSNWKMPYTINFHAQAGSAFHQFAMPGRPVSHSCCRQFMSDAEWLYYWGRGFKKDANRKRLRMSGTPVVIVDHFNFSRKRGGPWLELKSNKDFFLELPDDPMGVEEAVIPISQIPEGSRWGLKDINKYIHGEDTLRARGILRPHVRLIVTKNFNDIRREKALAKAKIEAEAKKKAEEAAALNPDTNFVGPQPSTDDSATDVNPVETEETINKSEELEREIKSIKEKLQNEQINKIR